MSKKDSTRLLLFLARFLAIPGRIDPLPEDWTDHVAVLLKAAHHINHHNISRCNRETTEREDKAIHLPQAKAHSAAYALGIGIYVRGDPRGMPLYLVPLGLSFYVIDSTYPTIGIAVPL